MQVLRTWLKGFSPLERQFHEELDKRKRGETPQQCTYRGLKYKCSGRAGHWGILEG
jgi:hypothetical protein